MNFIGIIMALVLISICSCTDSFDQGVTIQISENQNDDTIAQVRDALNNMHYYGTESIGSRADLITKEELDVIFKIVIADVYGYISSNSNSTEGKIRDCITTSAAMAIHIVMTTSKDVSSETSLRLLSKYISKDSSNLDNLVLTNRITTLEDSIGYYHNLCLVNSTIEFDISQPLNIDSISRKINKNLPKRISNVEANTSFVKEFFETKIPAIYQSEQITSVIDVFAQEKLPVEDFNELYEPFIMGLYNNNGFLDNRNYINSLNVIYNSNLSRETKQLIENAIIITYASAMLWDAKSFLQYNIE